MREKGRLEWEKEKDVARQRRAGGGGGGPSAERFDYRTAVEHAGHDQSHETLDNKYLSRLEPTDQLREAGRADDDSVVAARGGTYSDDMLIDEMARQEKAWESKLAASE